MPITTIDAEPDLDWLWEGDMPTAAEEADDVRLDMIGDDLDRACEDPDAAAFHLSGAFSAYRNRGDAPIGDEHHARLLATIAGARRAAVPKLPPYAQGRIAAGLEALAQHVAHHAGCDVLADDVAEADCRDRMRVAQNQAHSLSLIGDIAGGRIPGRIAQLLRIVQNEAENLALLAGIAARSRAAGRLAA